MVTTEHHHIIAISLYPNQEGKLCAAVGIRRPDTRRRGADIRIVVKGSTPSAEQAAQIQDLIEDGFSLSIGFENLDDALAHFRSLALRQIELRERRNASLPKRKGALCIHRGSASALRRGMPNRRRYHRASSDANYEPRQGSAQRPSIGNTAISSWVWGGAKFLMTARKTGAAKAAPDADPTRNERSIRRVGRPCKVCNHQQIKEIDAAILAGDATDGEVARKFALGHDAVARHRVNHVPTKAMRAAIAEHVAGEGAHALDLLASADELRSEALRVLRETQESGDREMQPKAIREAARLLELMGKLRGEVNDSVQVNVMLAPVIGSLQSVILVALLPFPAARAAVLTALDGLLASDPTPALIEHSA